MPSSAIVTQLFSSLVRVYRSPRLALDLKPSVPIVGSVKAKSVLILSIARRMRSRIIGPVFQDQRTRSFVLAV